MKTSTVAVSVITPVYNTEKYFDKMISSVINQSLRNIEIIVINDCSNGNIKELITNYLSSDSRIKYYKTQKNSGVGGARNLGMEYATGEYIMFLDSDDWVSLDTLEAMYDVALRENADVVNCGFYRDFNNGEKKWDCYYDKDFTVDGITALKMLAHQYDYGVELCVAATNKIYRRQLIKGILFAENVCYEEALFNFMVIQKTNIVAFSKTGKYTYFKRPGSNLQSIKKKHIKDFHAIFMTLKKQLIKNDVYNTLKHTYIAYIEYFFYILLEQIYESSEKEEKKKKLIIEAIRSFNKLLELEDYIEYLGVERFRWNLQPLMLHNGEHLL